VQSNAIPLALEDLEETLAVDFSGLEISLASSVKQSSAETYSGELGLHVASSSITCRNNASWRHNGMLPDRYVNSKLTCNTQEGSFKMIYKHAPEMSGQNQLTLTCVVLRANVGRKLS